MRRGIHQLLIACAAATVVLPVRPALAQRDPNPGARMGQMFSNFANMTPDQRKQFQQQMQQMMLRMQEQATQQMLTDSGFTDQSVSDIITAFIEAKAAARAPVRDVFQDLQDSLQSDPPTSDDDIKTKMQAVDDAVDKERTRTKDAEKELDDKIGYKSKPRLKAILVTQGIVGDEQALSTPGMPAFGRRGFGGPGGPGGPGGGPGGPGGGFGGPGGGPGGPGGGPGGPPPAAPQQ